MTAPETAPDGYEHLHSGKVRDLYRAPDGDLLLVASDRMSAYDHILPTPIPDKGRILTAMTHWWFGQLAEALPNHLISVDAPDVPAELLGRAMLCRPLAMLPVEAVARGYLTGGGLLDYQATGSICGIALPDGLVDGSALPETIFTPATKATVGEHDENVSFAAVVEVIGPDTAAQVRDTTIDLYERARTIAAERGIILADTKFEFGHDPQGRLVLGDEVLTPDSSRFWPAELWEPGHTQASFDKQFVRDWLTSPASGWDRRGDSPPPELPEDVVAATRARYVEAYERLSGLRFDDWLGSSVA